jgi:hypothetical protein
MIEDAIGPSGVILDRLKVLHNLKDKNSGPSWKERKEAKKKEQDRRAERKCADNSRGKSKKDR